jgi:hypothetical protein
VMDRIAGSVTILESSARIVEPLRRTKMEVCEARDIHDRTTQLSHLTYCFTPKHHGAGSRSDARWLPGLPRAEEFAVFDMADLHQLSDDDGNLYGLRIRQDNTSREVLELGTRHEMIARFWVEAQRNHWHGHPLWPVSAEGPLNRKGQAYRPPKEVFARMVAENLLTEIQAGRLKTGRHLRNL